MKKKYLKPRIEIRAMQIEGSVMIPVSGTTTPEESQAKQLDMWSDKEDGDGDAVPRGVWDDEEEKQGI